MVLTKRHPERFRAGDHDADAGRRIREHAVVPGGGMADRGTRVARRAARDRTRADRDRAAARLALRGPANRRRAHALGEAEAAADHATLGGAMRTVVPSGC
jgi:hypothetical protein